ncbi:Lcl C-terminal domain-containing protein [Breznakiellaceae bacterium SP9]
MKKIVFFAIPLLMAIMGCASAPAPAAPTPAAEVKGMDLDAAIKEAASKMGTSLPAKTEVALVSIASSSAQFSEYIIARLEAALVDDGKLVVLDRANLDKVREEQGFHLSGEVDDNSAKAIGKLLGAGAIVTGSFVNLGDVYGLSLKAINMTTAAIAASYPADIAKSTRIETLLASGGGGAGTALPTQAPRPSVSTATAPASPSAGFNATGNVTAPSVTVPSAGLNVTGNVAQPVVQAPAQPTSVRPTPATTVPATPAPVYKVGDKGPAGGIVFYDKGNSSDGWRYLEAAPASTEFKLYSGSSGRSGITDVAVGSGKQNTRLIAAALLNSGDIGAALLCVNLEIGGYMDWFLPSKAELSLMYRNLATKSLGNFKSETYLSSSESGSSVWVQRFSDGSQSTGSQGSVRVVRAFSGGETPAASVVATGAYKVGDKGPAGGIVFYDKGDSSDGWRYLEAAPASAEFKRNWGVRVTSDKTKVAVGYGKQNTRLIAAALENQGEIGAALLCTDLEIGGYRDWFLTSKGELNLMYMNLAMKGLGSFKDGIYWSSSQDGNNGHSWYQRFSDGYQAGGLVGQDYSYSVRAVRAFSGGETPAASTVAAGAYKVGDKGPAGGIIFYDKGNSSDGWRYLEAAPASAEFKRNWGLDSTNVTTDVATGTGKQNTRAIAAALENQGEIGAALLCVDLEIGGYKDWFLPSKAELNLIYRNLVLKNLGSFKSEWYWSSSQGDNSSAWVQRFSDGVQYYSYDGNKRNTRSVRAVRAF